MAHQKRVGRGWRSNPHLRLGLGRGLVGQQHGVRRQQPLVAQHPGGHRPDALLDL